MSSINSLKKTVRKLQRKVDKEKRRQELVLGLHQQIQLLSEEYLDLQQMGTPEKLYSKARQGMSRKEDFSGAPVESAENLKARFAVKAPPINTYQLRGRMIPSLNGKSLL